LTLVEGVGKLNVNSLAVLLVKSESNWLANSELSAQKVNLVLWVDLVVVGGVRESEGKHTLLLQVRLVNTGERSGNDGKTTQMPWLKGGVLTRTTLAVVPVTNNDPLDALG